MLIVVFKSSPAWFSHAHTLRDGPLENLWGGRAKYKKKYSPKGTSNEKNSCYGLRKSYKKFDNEKIPAGRKFPNHPPPPPPPPPHNVFNGPSHDERCRIGDQNLCLARRLITNVVAEDSLIDWLKIDIRTHVFW